jgi:hypothetical protein
MVQCYVQCASAPVVRNESQNRGDKNRVNGQTVLTMLFWSDLELARVALNPSPDPSNPYVQLLEEGPA